MSQLKVNTIRHTGASSDAVTLASDGTCTAKITNNLSNRNLLINGQMAISQRGDVAGENSSGYKALDRYRHTISIGTWSISKSTDSPDGFGNSLKMDCTTAEASPSATDGLAIVQKIEGQNLQQLKKGTSGAEKLTFSFWIKCTKTGTAAVNLVDEDNSRMIGQQFAISSTNTWEKKTLTFAGDTTGALGNDNGSSLRVEIWLDAGADYKSGSTPTSWETLASTDYFAGGTLNLGDNTSNDVYITGLQLEVGDVATDFEHRSYGDELLRCQRYFWKLTSDSNNDGLWFLMGYNASNRMAVIPHPVVMRANPTITQSINGSAVTGPYNPSTIRTIFYNGQAYDAAANTNFNQFEASSEL